jgi:hypothetical protein
VLFNFSYITVFDFSENHFTGTIHKNVKNLRKVFNFFVNDNHLTGTLPTSISRLSRMQSFLVQRNQFHGHIDRLFNHSVQPYLENIDLSSNSFKGDLPLSVFKAKSIRTFAAIRNCFRFRLSTSMCEASTLLVLALDGLSAAPACQNSISDYSKAYNLKYAFHGKQRKLKKTPSISVNVIFSLCRRHPEMLV